MKNTSSLTKTMAVAALAIACASAAQAAPTISRMSPPSALFSFGDATPPIIARFLPGQRFDLQVTVRPDAGETITGVTFKVNGVAVPGVVTSTPGTAAGLPANTTVWTLRAYSNNVAGIKTLTADAVQSDAQTASKDGNFEVVSITNQGKKAKNIIYLIGDGFGASHRTAARIMLNGVQQGKANAPLAVDQMPFTGLVMTASLNSIVTDSSPGAACYATGNKSNNNQQGCFPDDTTANFDNPRVELIGEYLARTQGKALGIVTTSDVFDATPGAFGTHTSNRGAGTGICDQYLDEAAAVGGLKVLLGGGRKWFLPNTTAGSARGASTDYVHGADITAGWGVAAGGLDAGRDLIADFQAAGFTYTADATALAAIPPATTKLLGLFALSNMNVALDKIGKRRGTSTIVDDYGFPDQPMLDEMTDKALQVLNNNANGFVLMVEAASIDKQAHNMDTERWILDTIEFDRAIAKVRCPDIPLIVISGAVGEETAVELLKNGATDFVLKDRLARLVPAVQRALREVAERDARRQAEANLRALNEDLERRVAERTRELSEKNAAMEEDLRMARELQMALLPQRFPTLPRGAAHAASAVKFCSIFHPASSVSGDFFNVVRVSETAVGVFICDVMGHGVRAALVTAMMRALEEQLGDSAGNPGALLTEINRGLSSILRQSGTTLFATACYLIADVATSRIAYANAGHPSPLLAASCR